MADLEHFKGSKYGKNRLKMAKKLPIWPKSGLKMALMDILGHSKPHFKAPKQLKNYQNGQKQTQKPNIFGPSVPKFLGNMYFGTTDPIVG